MIEITPQIRGAENKPQPPTPRVRWFCSGEHAPSPPYGEVHIRTVCLREPHDVSSLRRLLNREERLREQAFATESLRRRYAVAHGWLRLVLARYLSCDAAAVKILTLPLGKPYVPQERLFFNMSHTDARVLIAVGADGPLGVDVEEVRRIPEARTIARRWFSPQERQWLKTQEHHSQAFLRCWVRREALLKAIGTGFGPGMERFNFCPPPAPFVVRMEGSAIHVRDMQPDKRCVCALAACNNCKENDNAA